jgi:hypothetical protein
MASDFRRGNFANIMHLNHDVLDRHGNACEEGVTKRTVFGDCDQITLTTSLTHVISHKLNHKLV